MKIKDTYDYRESIITKAEFIDELFNIDIYSGGDLEIMSEKIENNRHLLRLLFKWLDDKHIKEIIDSSDRFEIVGK